MAKHETPGNETPATIRTMKAVTGAFAKFETAGDAATGSLQGHTFVETANGAVPKYTLLGDDGEAVSFLGTTQIIDVLARVPLGGYVEIVYTGKSERTGKGFNVKIFDIQIDANVELMEPINPMLPAYNPTVSLGPAVDPQTGEISAF